MPGKSTTIYSAAIIITFFFSSNSYSSSPNADNTESDTLELQNKASTVTDIDGNVYRTVTIGDQVWMAENLRVVHYRNGDNIPNVRSDTKWEKLTTGAYCNHDNDTSYVATYGRIYNWYAVNDSRILAPEGWHVASDDEWQKLVDYLGGQSVAGGKLKESGTTHWDSPNTGATNMSGFSALPAGDREDGPEGYYDMGSAAYFWTSTSCGGENAWYRGLGCGGLIVAHSKGYKRDGSAVRCIKD